MVMCSGFNKTTGLLNHLKPFVMLCYAIHSFIHSGYLFSAVGNLLYPEALTVQLRPKRNVLRCLQKKDTLFRSSKHNLRGSSFQVEGPITEKARRCLSAERVRGKKSSPLAEERRAGWNAICKFETDLQRSDKICHAMLCYVMLCYLLKV